MDYQINPENFIGVVEVCIHQARNIHDICIYQNQDVFAKLFLTDNPDNKILSQVIHGGGKNPVFNETVKLGARTMDSSLRCEVWMMSRIKNYLQDQLLGFALIPLSDVVSETESGKPSREFELSSSELVHSPAGFVELSFSYKGKSSELTEISLKSRSSVANNFLNDDVGDTTKKTDELDGIEFVDHITASENERMLSKYLSSETVGDTSGSSSKLSLQKHDFASLDRPCLDVNIVGSREKAVQEEMVDMYMKGMQQFTDELAKMRLPVDVVGEEYSSSDGKAEGSKSPDRNSKVFYGSGAFF